MDTRVVFEEHLRDPVRVCDLVDVQARASRTFGTDLRVVFGLKRAAFWSLTEYGIV